MAATGAMGIAWMMTSLMGMGLLGLPLGVPPLPPDPALFHAAPEDCLWYATSAGMATPVADSENQTEQLFAEEELHTFVAEVEREILRKIRREVRGREERVLATEIPKLVKLALTRPLAVYVADVQPPADRRGPPTIRAGMIVNLGDQRREIEQALTQLLRLAGDAPAGGPTEGSTWQSVPLPPDAPPIAWTIREQYLLVAVGEGEAAALVDRLDAKSEPAWLSTMRDDLSMERLSTMGYLNVERVVKIVEPLLGEERRILSFLGLDNVQRVFGGTGMDEVACVGKLEIHLDGPPRGILAMLPHEPLGAGGLQTVPADAMAAFAIRLNGDELLSRILEITQNFEPRARDHFEEMLWEMEHELGVNLRSDILRTLDDTFVVYLPGGPLMTSWLGTTAVIQVKDATRLENSLSTLVLRAQQEFARQGGDRAPEFREVTYRGNKIRYLQIREPGVPFTPAWCVADDKLVIGLTPQTIKTFLSRDAGSESIVGLPRVQEAIDSAPQASVLSYVDTPQMFRGIYPMLQFGAQMASSELEREGLMLDVSLLPSVESIASHLVPGVSTWSRTEKGFAAESRQSLPSGDLVATAPILVALTLPALASARMSSRDQIDMNHLKQIVLAVLNHESAVNEMPNNIRDANNKPLLSWRVKILPFTEHQALYEQFHLDEPWDSPHNRQLVERMPGIFASPNRPARPGYTHYLGFSHPDAMFPPDKNVRMNQITDGLSRTALVFRVAPGAGVPWTKPEDLSFDRENPLKNLSDPRGRVLVGFADGHIERLDLKQDLELLKEVFRALITRNGNEVVDTDSLRQ